MSSPQTGAKIFAERGL